MSALYVHIPFCDKKCFYCSFAVSVGQRRRTKKYLECLNVESQKYKNKKIETIYVGGGTPTFLSADELCELFENINNVFDVSAVKEIIIEANPEGLTKEKLMRLKGVGVSRISLGVQTFNDKYLKYLGRIHSQSEAREAYDLIRSCGFDNVSLDLMFGFPEQSMDELGVDIEEMNKLNSEHISLYALTIDPKSRFFTKQVKLQSKDEQQHKYEYILERLSKTDFKQYEVSNFAKQGFESIHNIKYWKCEDYIGLGMGAHSFIGGTRFSNSERLTDYIKKIEANESVVMQSEDVSAQDRLTEALVFGLRMNKGVELSALEKRYGLVFKDEQKKKIAHYIDGKLLNVDGPRVCTTRGGQMVLDTISAELI